MLEVVVQQAEGDTFQGGGEGGDLGEDVDAVLLVLDHPEETGETLTNESPDAVMAIGTLEGGGLVNITLVGGTPHDSTTLIYITGTDGVLKLTNPFGNAADFDLEGARGGQTELSRMPTPAEYQLDLSPSLDASVEDLAVLYQAYAHDQENGTSEATTFKDAVAMHRTLDQIETTSKEFTD